MPQNYLVVRQLFAEYLRWATSRFGEEYPAVVDPEPMIVHDMDTIEKFLPPRGFLLIAYVDDFPVGCAAVHGIEARIAELQRVYVRPSHRRKGIGGALVEELIRRVDQTNFEGIRLYSPRFMVESHRIYRSHGFTEISPYEESEIPEEHRKYFLFMALKLGKDPNELP